MKLNPINRALVVTLLVLAGLVGIRLVQQAVREPPGFRVNVPPDEVQAISLASHDRVLRIGRADSADGGWSVILPGWASAPADRASVARLLASWQDVQTSYMVSPEGPAASRGFDGSTVLRLEARGGEELLAVEIGERLPSGDRYLRKRGDQAVYAGPVAAADLLVADPARWVDRAALATAAARVVSFELLNEHGEQVFERKDGRWTRGGHALKDRAVTRLVISALELGLAHQLDAKEALEAGAAARTPRISLRWEDPEGGSQVVHLCGDVPGGDQVYLDRETEVLFTVPRDELQRFGVRPSDLDAAAP